MSAESLRAYVHARMRDKGVPSQAALARQAGISKNTLTNWFSGATAPAAYELYRVAEVLGVGVADLWTAYGGDPRPETPEEERVEQLIREAYERGYDVGFRAGRQSVRDEST